MSGELVATDRSSNSASLERISKMLPRPAAVGRGILEMTSNLSLTVGHARTPASTSRTSNPMYEIEQGRFILGHHHFERKLGDNFLSCSLPHRKARFGRLELLQCRHQCRNVSG